jgi:tRNA A37 threonylcarbamoyladenosine biosynthesis protein TsaE
VLGNGVQSLRPPPIANAGADQDVSEGATVTLDGSTSTGRNLTYAWTQTAGTAVVLSDDTAESPTFTGPPVAAAGETLTFQLTVTDVDGQTDDSNPVDVNVVDSPVANAGVDQNVAEGSTVTLNGSASTGRNLTYAWVAPAGITLSATNVVSPTFTAPDVAAAGEIFTFQLTVTDDLGTTSSADTVDVNVADASASPVANAGADQVVAPGDTVTLDGTGSTGTGLTYAWSQTAGTLVQLAGDDTASPTFTAPNAAEINAAVLDTLTFQLTVTDGNNVTSTDSVDVSVDDAAGTGGGGGGGGGGGCFINSMF